MDRIKKLLAGTLLAASLLALSTCDNPVDMLSEIEVKVMQANDRYLEVVSIDAVRLLNTSLVSPSAKIVVVFDRGVDPTSLGNISLLENGLQVAVEATVTENILRLSKDPYFDNTKVYELSLQGLIGVDGS